MTARIKANRAAFLARYGPEATADHSAYIARLCARDTQIAYRADHRHNLCRANGIVPVEVSPGDHKAHPQSYAPDDYTIRRYHREQAT